MIHTEKLIDVAIGLKSLDLPVLLVLEIVKYLLYQPGLIMFKEWEIARIVKEK